MPKLRFGYVLDCLVEYGYPKNLPAIQNKISIYCDLTFLLMRVVGVIYLELDGYRVQAYEWSMRLVLNIQIEICCSLKGFEIKVLLVTRGANILVICW